MAPASVERPVKKSLALRLWGFGARLLVFAAIGFAVFYGQRLLPRKSIPVRTARAMVGTVREVVSASAAGEVAPAIHATLRAEIAGRVVALLARRGARVKMGELILSIDAADLDARLKQAQAAASAAMAQRAQAEARLATLRRQAERAQLLAQRGAGPMQLSEDAQASVTEAERALQVADGQLAQAQAALQAARVQRRRAELVAPFAGLLTDVAVSVGDSLTPGVPVVEVIDDSRLHVDATVDEADAARVRIGQLAELRLDAWPDRTFAGQVVRLDPVVKRDLKGARTLTVEVEVSSVDSARAFGLMPGMSANVEILVTEKKDVLSIPANVIVGRGMNRFVYVVQPDSRGYRVRRQPIVIGLANWERAEVLSGLHAGELVVASLNEKGLDDGVGVTLIDTPASGR